MEPGDIAEWMCVALLTCYLPARRAANQLELFRDGPRPTVGDDDRQGVGMAGADVNEVDVQTIDRRHELRQRIELRFQLSPVVGSAPVASQLLDFGELYALRSIGNRFLVGPTRGDDPAAKVI